jgi:thiol-disulfide isomerase/thioredoxin
VLFVGVLVSGCISTERPFFPLTGVLPANTSTFGKVCEDNGDCIPAWFQRSARPGLYIGGLYLADRDTRDITLHKLDDEHYLVQVVEFGGQNPQYAQYLLLRSRKNQLRAYSIEVERLNLPYLRELEAAGMVKDTTNDLMRRAGLLNWKVQNREGIVRIFTDVSKLTEAQLSSLGKNVVISSTSTAEFKQKVIERKTVHAKWTLEKGVPSMNFTSTTSGAKGCPAVLPPKVFCKQYPKQPNDPYPLLAGEVIHFDKYTCGHCRNIEGYVAAWQLANQNIPYYANTVKDWDERETIAYDVERVPAFAVNRKYIVSLETSDKQLVEYALNLVTALANER